MKIRIFVLTFFKYRKHNLRSPTQSIEFLFSIWMVVLRTTSIFFSVPVFLVRFLCAIARYFLTRCISSSCKANLSYFILDALYIQARNLELHIVVIFHCVCVWVCFIRTSSLNNSHSVQVTWKKISFFHKFFDIHILQKRIKQLSQEPRKSNKSISQYEVRNVHFSGN